MGLEIEIKAKCRNPQAIKKRLKLLGAEFKGRVRQRDTYYIPSAAWRRRVGPRLRLRHDLENQKLYLEYHEPQGNYSAKETEIEIADLKTADYILRKLGFKVDVVIEKIREKYRLDGINIDLDRVKNLGDFIEVEIMNRQKSSSVKHLKVLLEKLGVPQSDYKDFTTYLFLMWQKKGKKIIN